MAPELFPDEEAEDNEDVEPPEPPFSPKSDVYAFAMVAFQVFWTLCSSNDWTHGVPRYLQTERHYKGETDLHWQVPSSTGFVGENGPGAPTIFINEFLTVSGESW
jgi:hypothetical protein